MKALKIIVVAVILLVIVGVVGFVVETDVHVERTATINAPKKLVMAELVSFKSFNQWSAWSKIDPECKYEYKGTDGEVGSSYTWEGNEDVGKGFQELSNITDSRIESNLKFMEPMESESTCYYDVTEKESGTTEVTWGFDGKAPLLMSFFMDDMLGPQFSEGLESLDEWCKTKIESTPKTYRGYEVNEIDFGARTFILYKDTVSFQDITAFYTEHFTGIMTAAAQAGIQPTGAPCGIFWSWDEENEQAYLGAAIPVSAEEGVELEGYERLDLADRKALHIAYYGAYDKSADAHYGMDEYMQENNLESEFVLEEYLTDPGQEPDTSKWQTNIYYLIN